MPRHPKTRLVDGEFIENNEKGYYVASKGIKNFRDLHDLRKKYLFVPGREKFTPDLGEIVVVAVYLAESDLKRGHLGLDVNGRLVKIDGDLCFKHLLKPKDACLYRITVSDINTLPVVRDYQPNNWLGIWGGSKFEGLEVCELFFHSPSFASTSFRRNVNRSILRIITLPDSVLKGFIESYVDEPSLSDKLFNTMQARRDQLEHEALQNVDFRKYMLTDTAKRDFENHKKTLAAFNTTSKHNLMARVPDGMNDVDVRLDGINLRVVSTSHYLKKIRKRDAFIRNLQDRTACKGVSLEMWRLGGALEKLKTYASGVLCKDNSEVGKMKYQKAIKLVNTIYRRAFDYCDQDKASEEDFKTFHLACQTALKKVDQAFSEHRTEAWMRILAEIGLAIVGVGVLYAAAGLINLAVNGHFTFFNAPPRSCQKAQEIAACVSEITLIA